MKLFRYLVIALALISVKAFGQSNATFDTALGDAWHNFQTGELTNVAFIAGASQNGHQWGGFGALAYNMQKASSLPLQPYLTPMVGIWEFGNSWQGFSGSVTLKTDLHVLREFAGTSSNGFFYNFALTPNAGGGVMQTLSGETFGTFKVPGKGIPGSTQAVTMYGVSCGIADIKGWEVGLFYERVSLSDVSNPFNTEGAFIRKRF